MVSEVVRSPCTLLSLVRILTVPLVFSFSPTTKPKPTKLLLGEKTALNIRTEIYSVASDSLKCTSDQIYS